VQFASVATGISFIILGQLDGACDCSPARPTWWRYRLKGHRLWNLPRERTSTRGSKSLTLRSTTEAKNSLPPSMSTTFSSSIRQRTQTLPGSRAVWSALSVGLRNDFWLSKRSSALRIWPSESDLALCRIDRCIPIFWIQSLTLPTMSPLIDTRRCSRSWRKSQLWTWKN